MLAFCFTGALAAGAQQPAKRGLYVALGDSITAGTGTTKSCKPFPRVPIQIGDYCADGTSYPLVVARGLLADGRADRILNLGIPGATAGQVLRDEVPLIPPDATIITLYVGTNDSRQFGKIVSSASDVITEFIATYQQILQAISQRAPAARVILVNVPNEGVIARSYKIDDEHRSCFGEISTAFDAWINSQYPRYAVVDTACDARSYDPGRRYNGSVHLNDSGAADLAELILKVVRAPHPPAPESHCQWLPAPSSAPGKS